MELNFPLVSNSVKSSAKSNFIQSMATTQQSANKYIDSLNLTDVNMNKKEAMKMLSAYDTKKQREAMLKSYYHSDKMSFEDYSAKIDICKMLHEQNPLFSVDYYMKNFDMFMEKALGFKANPSSYLDGINKALQSGFSNIWNGIKVTKFLLDTLGTNENSMEYVEKRDRLMDSISSSMAKYRNDLATEKYSGLLSKMGLATALQAPQIATRVGVTLLTGGLGASASLANTLGTLPMAISTIGNAAETALDAGFGKDTALAMALGVGALNLTLEYIGDSPTMGNVMKFLKRKNSNEVNELVVTSFRQVLGNIGKDVVDSLKSEVPTELMQTAVEMLGYNFALNFEKKYKGKFQDLVGYSARDFGKALSDTAIQTALSTPLLTVGPSALKNLGNMYGGEWGQARSASTYTKYENGASTKQAASIINTYNIKKEVVDKNKLKKNPISPLSTITIGEKSFLYNPTDEALTVHATTKGSKNNYVYTKEEDFGVFRFFDSKEVADAKVSDLKVPLETAFGVLQKRFAKDHDSLEGYSLLDKDKKETKSMEDAKYIAVKTEGVDEPAIITIGEEGSSKAFEEEVFGSVIQTKQPETKKQTEPSDYTEDEEQDEEEDAEEEKKATVSKKEVEEAIKQAEEAIGESKPVEQEEQTEQPASEEPNADATAETESKPSEAEPATEPTPEPSTEPAESQADVQPTESTEPQQASEPSEPAVVANTTEPVDNQPVEQKDAQPEAQEQVEEEPKTRKEKADEVATKKQEFQESVKEIAEITGANLSSPVVDESTIEADTEPEQVQATEVKAEQVAQEADATASESEPAQDASEKKDNDANSNIATVKALFKNTFASMNKEGRTYRMNLEQEDIELFSEAATIVATAFSGIEGIPLYNYMVEGKTNTESFFNYIVQFANNRNTSPVVTIGKIARFFIENANPDTDMYKEIADLYSGLREGQSEKNRNRSMVSFENDFREYVLSGKLDPSKSRIEKIFMKLKETLSMMLDHFRRANPLSDKKNELFEKILNYSTSDPEILQKLTEIEDKANQKPISEVDAAKQIVDAINSVSKDADEVLGETNNTANITEESVSKPESIEVVNEVGSEQDIKEEAEPSVEKEESNPTAQKITIKKDAIKKSAKKIVDAIEKTSDEKIYNEYKTALDSYVRISNKLNTAKEDKKDFYSDILQKRYRQLLSIYDNLPDDIANQFIDPHKTNDAAILANINKQENSNNTNTEEVDDVKESDIESTAIENTVDPVEVVEVKNPSLEISNSTYEKLTGIELQKGEKASIYNASISNITKAGTNNAVETLRKVFKNFKNKSSKISDPKLYNELANRFKKKVNSSIENIIEYKNTGLDEKFIAAAKELTFVSKLYQILTIAKDLTIDELLEGSILKSVNELITSPKYSLENILNTVSDFANSINLEDDEIRTQYSFEFEVPDTSKAGVLEDDANWEEINCEYPDHVIKTKNGLLVFDRKKLARDIVESTDGEISTKTAKLAASMLCIMPKSTQDAFIRRNGGRLVMSATEAGIDLGLGVRGISLLKSAKIILNETSDLSTVLHEAFHLMITYDTEARDNIYSAIRDAFSLKGKDYEELAKFVEKNIPIFVGRSYEMVMEDFELITKELLTGEEEIRLEEAIASLYEAWLRNEKRDTGILGKIGQLFKVIADKFKDIYSFVTGTEFLPESVDIALQSLFTEKDSKIYHYNERDVIFRAQQSLQKNANNPALKEGVSTSITNVLFEGINNVVHLYDEFAKHYSKGFDEAVAFLESKGMFDVLNNMEESIKNDLKKAAVNEMANLNKTPSYVAYKLHQAAKTVEADIKNGNFGIEIDDTPGSDFMKEPADKRKAIKSAKKNFENFKTLVDGLIKQVQGKVSNYGSFKIAFSGMLQRVGATGNAFAEIAETHNKKDRSTKAITPEEYVSFVRQLVNDNGEIILGNDVDGHTWSPLIDMMCVINSEQTGLNYKRTSNIDLAPARYVSTSEAVLYSATKNDRTKATKGSISLALRTIIDFFSDMGKDIDLVKFLDQDNYQANIDEILIEIVNGQRECINKINKRTNDSQAIKTLQDIDNVIRKIQKSNPDAENKKNLEKAKEKIEALKKEKAIYIAENKKLGETINKLEENIKNLEANMTEQGIASLMEERDMYMNLLDEYQKKTIAEIDKLKRNLEALSNSREKSLIEQMIEKRNKAIERISASETSNGCEANAVSGIKRIAKMMMNKNPNSKAIKFIPAGAFNGPSWNPNLYDGLVASLIKHGFIAKAKDAGIDMAKANIPTKDGKPMYDENSWVVVKGFQNIGAGLISVGVLNEIGDEVDSIIEKGKKETKRLKKLRDDRAIRFKNIIIESFKNIGKLNGYDAAEFANYLASGRFPGSQSQIEEDKLSLYQGIQKDFLLVSQEVRRASPALYAYMFGGIVDEVVDGNSQSSYVNRNLNTAANMEASNKSRRITNFDNEIMRIFGINHTKFGQKVFGIKGAKYDMHRLFSQERITLGNMSLKDFEFKTLDLGKYDEKTRSQLIESGDENLIAIAKYKTATQKALNNEKKSLKSKQKELTLAQLRKDEEAIENIQADIEKLREGIEYKESLINGDGTPMNAEYTMQQIMGIYILAQQDGGIQRLTDRSSTTVVSNNIGFNNILWVMDQMKNNKEFEKYRELADYIIRDMEDRYAEIAEVYYRINDGQRILKKIDMYFPFIHTDNQGEFMEIAKSMNFALLGSVTDKKVDESFTKAREGSLLALDLNVIDNYITALSKQEHYIAFKEITDEMSQLFNDEEVQRSIRFAYKGKKGKAERLIKTLNTYLNNIKNTAEAVEETSRLLTRIRSNFAVSKLWGNASSMLQQIPTFMLVASKVGFTKALVGFVSYCKGISTGEVDALVEKSPQIKERVRYEVAQYRAIDRSETGSRDFLRKLGVKDGAFEMYDKVIDGGLYWMEWFDNGVTKSMYYVMYNEMYADKRNLDVYKDMSDEEYEATIINEASQAILDMVPSQNVKDNALIFSSRDNYVKDLLLFTSQLNKQFNMIYGALSNAKEDFTLNTVMQSMGDILTIMFVSSLACIIGGSAYPADDEEDKWHEFFTNLLWGTLAETVSGVPFVGSTIRDVVTGYSYAESNIANEVIILAKKLGDTDTKRSEYVTSAFNLSSEILTYTGAPSTFLQKVYRTVKAMVEDASLGDLGYLINTNTGKFTGGL